MTVAGDAIYTIERLRHRYGDRTVLDLPDLAVARGDTLGVVGPSGAGKTTLLRLLQWLEPPSEGEIRFEGARVTHPPPLGLRRRVVTVFQRPRLLDRTVRDNVALGLRLRGRRDSPLVAPLLDRLELTRLAATPARTLSGGEIQRVALARALAVTPDVLLLDEPAANLDPGKVALVEDLIRGEQRRGTTIVLVTHNAHEARRLATRTVLLLDGRLIEAGPTEQFFTAARDPRVRAFLNGDLVY